MNSVPVPVKRERGVMDASYTFCRIASDMLLVRKLSDGSTASLESRESVSFERTIGPTHTWERITARSPRYACSSQGNENTLSGIGVSS